MILRLVQKVDNFFHCSAVRLRSSVGVASLVTASSPKIQVELITWPENPALAMETDRILVHKVGVNNSLCPLTGYGATSPRLIGNNQRWRNNPQ